MAKFNKYIVDKKTDDFIEGRIKYWYYTYIRNFDFEDFRAYCLVRYWKCLKDYNVHNVRKASKRTYANKCLRFVHVDYLRSVGYDNRLTYKPPEITSLSDVHVNSVFYDTAKDIEDKVDFEKVLSLLKPRSKELFEMYYTKGYTLKTISRFFNVGESRVSQILSEEISKLKEQLV